MTRALRRHDHCLDCGTPIAESANFCSHCGQENSDYRVSLKRLLGDLFEELFQLESRVWRSLADLFRHPGRLTAAYNAGRRVRYTSPLRLYILASVAYFSVSALLPATKSSITIDFGDDSVVNQRSTVPALGEPKSGVDRFVRQRLGLHDGMPLADVQRHTREVLVANAPKVMAVLVPIFAVLTMLFFRKPKLFFVEHLVLALHLHAVAFWLLLAGELTRWKHVSMVALLLDTVWLLLALRAIFQQRWWITIVKAGLVTMIYLTFVGIGIVVALLI